MYGFFSCVNLFLCYNSAMKKRLIAIIAALAVAVTALVAFAGCQSVSPQRLLLNSRPWESVDTEEYFVYDVVYSPSEGETVNGSYTVAVKGYAAGSSLTVGDFTYENPCFYVHAELTLDNGDYIITDSVVDPNIVALYGSEEKSERGTLTKYTARYDDGDCNYSYSVQNEGEEATISEGTIGMGDFSSSAYIDNTFLYQLVRCLPSVTSSLSFSVPNFVQGTKESASVAISSTIVNEPFSNGAETAEGEDAPTVACYAVTISLNRTFPGSGTPLICSLARDDYKLSDDASIKHMVVKMIEGATTYTLRTVSDSIPE